MRHKEATFACIKLNIPMLCPPRGTVPVEPGGRIGSFTHGIRVVFVQGCDGSSHVRGTGPEWNWQGESFLEPAGESGEMMLRICFQFAAELA